MYLKKSKIVLSIFVFSSVMLLPAHAQDIETATTIGAVACKVTHQIVEHGGGCRKSSPPGMCCHMDNRTGTVHCH